MPVQLKEIHGLMIEEKKYLFNKLPYPENICESHNLAIRQMSSRKIGLNREMLAKIISTYRYGGEPNLPDGNDYNIADSLISKEAELLEGGE